MSARRGRHHLHSTSWRFDKPADLDYTRVRPESDIREDLRQQLAVIHKRYLERWVYRASRSTSLDHPEFQHASRK